MSSSPSTTLLCFAPAIHHSQTSTLQCIPNHTLSRLFGIRSHELKDTTANVQLRLRCRIECKDQTRERTSIVYYPEDLQITKWSNYPFLNESGESHLLTLVQSEIKEYVDTIRLILVSMEDGEISVSAYDTAWVALIKDVYGNNCPQFPSCLEWISNNQLPDGSWGDSFVFEAHDRLLNTLACVVALKTWNHHPDKTRKGIKFVKENLCKLGDANAEHMPIAFEVAFPALIEMAQKLDINIPNDSLAMQEIYARKKLKLAMIPNDVLHTAPTSLLYTLEAMPGLEWDKILKLQFSEGLFLFSLSATAFAFMHTKDENCLRYLTRTVQKFNSGVPCVYPLDLFEHLWAVDRLERLGISRYFSSEIKDFIDYAERYWTEEGISWARNSRVKDGDDTSMGFRLLRSHGRKVSAEVFRKFRKDGEFVCMVGQSSQSLTATFNLYRATQVIFPGEKILEDAKVFSTKFLRDKQASNDLLDKWIITKDLPGEVSYALEVPWYASLPRVEARFYLEQYGGEDDIWIGKTLYRLPYVNNNTYLEFGKLDYNNCQAIHQVEWDYIQKWYVESNLEEYGMSQRSLLLAYFIAAASIFEPERWNERVAWAKTAVLVETIGKFFETNGFSLDLRKEFVNSFRNSGTLVKSNNGRNDGLVGVEGARVGLTLLKTLNRFILDVHVAHDGDIGNKLCNSWEMWLLIWQEEGYTHGSEAKLILQTLFLCSGHLTAIENHSLYQPLFDITNKVCQSLCRAQQENDPNKVVANGDKSDAMYEIESDMQKLVELVFSGSSVDVMEPNIKQMFLMTAKTYYYKAHVTPATIDSHIAKVLFDKVI